MSGLSSDAFGSAFPRQPHGLQAAFAADLAAFRPDLAEDGPGFPLGMILGLPPADGSMKCKRRLSLFGRQWQSEPLVRKSHRESVAE
jgi:hypothetical protein